MIHYEPRIVRCEPLEDVTLFEVGWVYRVMAINRAKGEVKLQLVGDLNTHPLEEPQG